MHIFLHTFLGALRLNPWFDGQRMKTNALGISSQMSSLTIEDIQYKQHLDAKNRYFLTLSCYVSLFISQAVTTSSISYGWRMLYVRFFCPTNREQTTVRFFMLKVSHTEGAFMTAVGSQDHRACGLQLPVVPIIHAVCVRKERDVQILG